MVGGWLGGVLGDYAAAHNNSRTIRATTASGNTASSQGRIVVALVSVLLGKPLYGLYLFETQFDRALFYMTVFQLVATWAPPAAIRPICAELTSGPSERAQIVALWIVLENLSGAVVGAPLVGYLTERMLNDNDIDQQKSKYDKTKALSFNIFLLSSIFWSLCAFFWFIMLLAIRRKPAWRRSQQEYYTEYKSFVIKWSKIISKVTRV